jgi:hypothetical protein
MDILLEWLPYLIPVILIQIGLMVLALVDLVRREATKMLPKWGWALVIVLINIIGPVVYLTAGREE